MVESAAILHQAGRRSLVILDEIGRGTATFDGLAIAWAVAEHLHDVNQCRAVFATHFHELTALVERREGCANVHVRAKEWKGDLVFLHQVRPGAADRSYGVQVAKLAGLPRPAVERARAVLAVLEAASGAARLTDMIVDEMPLFAASGGPERDAGDGGHAAGPSPAFLEAVRAELAAIDPDALSPREALEIVYDLKRRFAAGG